MDQNDTAKILAAIAALGQRIDGVDQKLTSFQSETDSRFNTLHDEANDRFDTLRNEMNDRFDQVYNQLDGIADVYEKDDTERVALGVQVDRHENWIKKTAPKVGVKLNYSN